MWDIFIYGVTVCRQSHVTRHTSHTPVAHNTSHVPLPRAERYHFEINTGVCSSVTLLLCTTRSKVTSNQEHVSWILNSVSLLEHTTQRKNVHHWYTTTWEQKKCRQCTEKDCYLLFTLFIHVYKHDQHPHQPLRGAPKASTIRSMVYLCCDMNMMGTPGIFLILLLKSLSQVATM